MGFHAERDIALSDFARHFSRASRGSLGTADAERSGVVRKAGKLFCGVQRYEHHVDPHLASDEESACTARSSGRRSNVTPIPAYDIVIAGHGSRDPQGVIEFENLVRLVRARANGRRVTHGFLEFARPTISEAIRENIASGSERIAIVPGLLLAATHAKNDIPAEVKALQKAFPNIKLHYGSALHLHPLILRLLREKIIESEAGSERLVRRSDSCLVIVGRGTTDPDANSE